MVDFFLSDIGDLQPPSTTQKILGPNGSLCMLVSTILGDEIYIVLYT